MCFGSSSSPPQPKAPPLPATERDSAAEAKQQTRYAVQAAKKSGFDATNLTQGSLQDSQAPVSKPILGA